MNKTELGCIAVVFGGLILALEIYGLKFMFLMERMSGLPWRESASAYLEEPTVKVALLITAGVIIYGLFLIVQGRKSSTP